MVQLKFDVTLLANDTQACRRVNKSILIRVWNRKEGSAWSRINEGLKSGVNPDLNVCCNYQLTNRRFGLLFEVRQLTRDKNISNYYTDENSQIQKRKIIGGRKFKLTFYSGPNSNAASKAIMS